MTILIQTFKKTAFNFLKYCQQLPPRVGLVVSGILFKATEAFAADPFGDMNITPSQLESKTGSTISQGLQWGLITTGVLLCAGCATRIWILVSGDKKEKDEQSHSVMQMLLLVVGAFLGLALIGIGWKGATATVTG